MAKNPSSRDKMSDSSTAHRDIETDEISMALPSSFHFDLDPDLDLDLEQNLEEKPCRKLPPSSQASSCGNDQMRKLIECPVCLEIPLPPIFLCERGHIVCTDCQLLTPNCPLCRGYYSKARSFVAEGIVENCVLKCKNYEQGCPKVMKGSQLVQHLKICDYRPINCVDCNNPESLIPFQEYTNHLINVHKINGVRETSGFVLYNIDLTRRIQEEILVWPPYYFIDEDQNTFLIRMHVSSAFVCAWVSFVGPKEDCSKYLISIEFHVPRVCLERSGNRRRFSLVWRGEANHFRLEDSYKDVFTRGMGLTIPTQTIKELGKVSPVLAEWLFQIQITNIQKEKEKEQAESSFSRHNHTNVGGTPESHLQSASNPSRKFSSRPKSRHPKNKDKDKQPPQEQRGQEAGDPSVSYSTGSLQPDGNSGTIRTWTSSAGDFVDPP